MDFETGRSTTSTSIVESNGNEGMSTEPSAGLHLPVDSVNKENCLKDKSGENDTDQLDNIEEAENSERKQNLQGQQIIVHSYIHDLIVEEPNHEKENVAVGLEKPKGQYEDPLAELESILLGSQKPFPKAACSASNVNIREAFHNLECLLEKSLDNIFGDIQLQQQLQLSLECA
ncbi:hypothetical protein RIF29_15431 [Crotalaria pallida]|uniref:Uncharacterized protein n=1 Tax=Crotalaria pallida TaxID=3830 RepID=A0AAN9IJ50_CROPI